MFCVKNHLRSAFMAQKLAYWQDTPDATVTSTCKTDELPFFDIPAEAIRFVFDLNFLGTLLPSQVCGKEGPILANC